VEVAGGLGVELIFIRVRAIISFFFGGGFFLCSFFGIGLGRPRYHD